MSSSQKTSFPLLTVCLFLFLFLHLPFSHPLGPTRPGSSLDPRQQTALESLGFPATSDACSVPSPRDNATSCDGAAPFRHLTSLRLANCSTDLDLPYTVLQSLSTLKSVSFFNCPIPPPRRFPPQLASSLHSFSCISSLRRVPGALLSPLRNLTELYLSGVPVTESAPIMIISQMADLTSLIISNANLSGPIPHHWHCLDLTHLDFSFNRLKGIIPGTISMLGSLQTFNLSSNFLTGNIPDSIGDMVSLKNVSLSNNSFFGSIPSSLSDLIDLVQLDLSSNHTSLPPGTILWSSLTFLLREVATCRISLLRRTPPRFFRCLHCLSIASEKGRGKWREAPTEKRERYGRLVGCEERT